MEGFWLVSGIAAVYSLDRYANSTPLLWRMLYALKHRGGGRMSICAFEDEDRFVTFTKPVEASSSSPPDELMSQLRSPYAIGYVGQEIQPFIRREKPVFATSLDGKLSDPARLRATYAMMGCRFETWEDVEVFSIALASEYGICSDWVDAFSGVMEEVDGGYALAVLAGDGDIIAARDPRGLKPLFLGAVGENFMLVASESCAIESVGGRLLAEIRPGEVLVLSDKRIGRAGGVVGRYPLFQGDARVCCMELVGHLSPETFIEGGLVRDLRISLGWALASIAQNDYLEAVVCLRQSDAEIAIGFSEYLGIPFYREALSKGFEEVGSVALVCGLPPTFTELRQVSAILRGFGASQVLAYSVLPIPKRSCFAALHPIRREELEETGVKALPVAALRKILGKNVCLACITGRPIVKPKVARPHKPGFLSVLKELIERR